MDPNEYVARIEREGIRAIAQTLLAMLKEMAEIKNELQDIKKKIKPEVVNLAVPKKGE